MESSELSLDEANIKKLEHALLHDATVSWRIDRRFRGQTLRSSVSRESHSALALATSRPDPVVLLNSFNGKRMPELIPLRWQKMMQSPFTFFRGSAALMAFDLGQFPTTGIRVQACGDCHLFNFGAFATPERNIVFDINDFDETLPAPFEWDVKRLATSFALVSRDNGLACDCQKQASQAVARGYRQATEKYSHMSVLDVWYSRLDWPEAIAKTADQNLMRVRADRLKKAMERTISDYYFPKLTEQVAGQFLIKDNPPVIFHPPNGSLADNFRKSIPVYRESLQEDKRRLFDRYKLADVAVKVVGIGSVGTLCAVALFLAPDNEPLLLQLKEANQSVLEPYAGKSEYTNCGQRVVAGQRISQSASDIFLGWTQFENGKHFYIRQMRDTKVKPEAELWGSVEMVEAAELMGAVLARAHARSGDSAVISGYLGQDEHFDYAVADFAMAYADQTERDYQTCQAAIRDATEPKQKYYFIGTSRKSLDGKQPY
jgi:uncharacterized protein (DUF2252 family)